MDEIFEHLLQDTDRGISINQIVNRIVFPNHDICMQAKAALERDYGEFCFAAVIPDYEDFQHMDPTDAINAALETCGSDGEEVTNVVWGYNSLQYEYNGIPSLEVAKTISKMIGVPVYYEYTDADEIAAGAVIADAQGDSVSFANVVDKSCWVYFPEGFDGATDTLFRCGMGTMSMPDGSQKYFEDTTDPIMRSYAQRGNVSLYFDFLKDQFGAQEEPQAESDAQAESNAQAESDAQASGNVYMSQAMGAMTFRIVFPNHDCCEYIRDDLEKCFGGFSLQAICGTPDSTFDSPDEVLRTMAGHGIPDDATMSNGAITPYAIAWRTPCPTPSFSRRSSSTTTFRCTSSISMSLNARPALPLRSPTWQTRPHLSPAHSDAKSRCTLTMAAKTKATLHFDAATARQSPMMAKRAFPLSTTHRSRSWRKWQKKHRSESTLGCLKNSILSKFSPLDIRNRPRVPPQAPKRAPRPPRQKNRKSACG